MKKIRPLDIIVLLLVITAGILCIAAGTKRIRSTVWVDGYDKTYEYSLDENGIHQIPGPLGNTTIEIRDRKVRIIESPCPGKNCVNQGWDNLIVCLPNKVIVTVEDVGEFDAVSE